jgi:hypothetical protein
MATTTNEMSLLTTMMNQIKNLQSTFETMDAYPKEAQKQATMDIVKGAGLTTPTLKHSPNGMVGAYRATNKKRSLIVNIKKNDGVDWDDLKTLSPLVARLMLHQFLSDDKLTIEAIFGSDYWNAYKEAMLGKDMDTKETTFKNVVRITWSCVMGDYLYWKTTANLYLEAMEEADTDLKRSIYAQKAKCAFTHAEGIMTGFNHSFPMANMTELLVEQ